MKQPSEKLKNKKQKNKVLILLCCLPDVFGLVTNFMHNFMKSVCWEHLSQKSFGIATNFLTNNYNKFN